MLITSILDETAKEIKEELIKTLTLELELVHKQCLHETLMNGKKCTVGDFDCTTVNLWNETADHCTVCVDGTHTSITTDDGPLELDYCAHNVSITNPHLNASVANDKPEVSVTNDMVLGKVPVIFKLSANILNLSANVSNKICNCTWALSDYKYKNGNLTILPIRRDLLYCDTKECDNHEEWLCINETMGICYNSTASCHLKDGIAPRCSHLSDIEIRVYSTCPQNSKNKFDCKFDWQFDKQDLTVNEDDFTVEWNKDSTSDSKIKNFLCKPVGDGDGPNCKGFPSCTGSSKVFRYNFTACSFTEAEIPPPSTASSTATPITSPSPETPSSSESTLTTWLILIIVVLLILIILYLGYQNYQKVS